MRVRRMCLAAGCAAGALVMWPAPAVAGGGCHRVGAATTEATGDTVELVGNCMNPMVLRTAAGSTVSFVNLDKTVHNVIGPGFRDDELLPGETLSHRFTTAGIYPYSCTLHPGMTGVVVAGDGPGAAVAPAATPPTVLTAARAGNANRAGDTTGASDVLLAAGLTAAVAGTGGYALGRRWRRRLVSA